MIVLKPLEWLYHGAMRVRRAVHPRGKRLHRPVISVGNIAAGGTGKTPAVIALCRHLTAQGLRVAVLTRGYKRADESITGKVADFDAGKYGDEPVLIARSTKADVLVGANRYENARDYDADVFILDDGFQHLKLQRDYDIVIDAPARFYREGRSALRHADAVIPRKLRLHVPEELRGERVFAFSGLADNAQFFASLAAAGLEVAGTASFPDHHRYTPADLARIKRDAKGARIVTTEKDAVKLDDPEIVAVSAEFEMPEDVLEEVTRVATAAQDRRRKRRKSAWLQRLEYIVYRAVARAVTSRSDESLHKWGTRLGTLASKVVRGRDRLAMRNLRATFPEKSQRELRMILDKCWQHFGREVLQSIRNQKLSLDEVAARCDFENAELLHEAIARGRGTVLITAHWGSWEIAGLVLTSIIENIRTVARPLDNELLEADLQKLRAKTGAEVVDRRKAARVLLRGLAENAVVVLLPDQAVVPREGVLVPFLGRPAWTTPAPAKMAVRSGSTIVFGFCRPDGLRHRIVLEEAVDVTQLAEDAKDPAALTTYINDVISRRIREQPELWLWMHDRWKGTGEREVHGV
jgi:tetraacyldisaccharide-1-P 4'-kinase